MNDAIKKSLFFLIFIEFLLPIDWKEVCRKEYTVGISSLHDISWKTKTRSLKGHRHPS
jgi:hypothetical protein